MTETTEVSATTPTVWHLRPERWRQTLTAKALSPLTPRDYLSTARRWADWLVAQGHDLEPHEVEDFHIDEFIDGIAVVTSAAFHYRNLRVYFGWLVKRKEITNGNPMTTTEPPKVPETTPASWMPARAKTSSSANSTIMTATGWPGRAIAVTRTARATSARTMIVRRGNRSANPDSNAPPARFGRIVVA
jgi:site-specific recombinase XerC